MIGDPGLVMIYIDLPEFNVETSASWFLVIPQTFTVIYRQLTVGHI